jgi:imidazolonepropionase
LKQNSPESAPKEQWTLVRRARQLLTLHGPSGARRGSALKQLSIVKDGALLIRNGVVVEAGMSRRVENLKQSRNAREIDAGGRIVLPAFVDPDAVLVFPPVTGKCGSTGRNAAADPSTALHREDMRLCLVSKHRLAQTGAASAADWARSGVLSVGAHTRHAADLRDTLRILRIHQTLQSKPLRIRSVYAPVTSAPDEAGTEELIKALKAKALPKIRQRKLAAIVEFTLDRVESASGGWDRVDVIRQAAIAAAALGYSIRMRTSGVPDQEMLELIVGAASVSLIAPPLGSDARVREMAQMAKFGCVHVLRAIATLDEDWKGAEAIRKEIEAGIPVAIASGFRAGSMTSLNPQFLLHLAVRRFGMLPEEAIVASSYNAACSLRMSHVTGSLEPGKAADLLIMDVSDYHDLFCRVGHNDVHLAMRAGNIVYRRGPLTLD